METLLGALTHALVRDAVEAEPVEPLELKGKAERVPAFRLIALASRERQACASPLVGRDDDLALLRASRLAAAAATGRGRLVDRRRRGRRRQVAARCASSPPASAPASARRARPLPAVRRRDHVLADRRGGALGGGDRRGRPASSAPARRSPRSRAATPRWPTGWRRRSASSPPCSPSRRCSSACGGCSRSWPPTGRSWSCIDDLHWAEPTLLDLVDDVVERVRRPCLVVCTARPEVLERPDAPARGRRSRPDRARAPARRRRRGDGRAACSGARTVDRRDDRADRDRVRRQPALRRADGGDAGRRRPRTPSSRCRRRSWRCSQRGSTGSPSRARSVLEPAAVAGLVFPSQAVVELVPDD